MSGYIVLTNSINALSRYWLNHTKNAAIDNKTFIWEVDRHKYRTNGQTALINFTYSCLNN